MTLVSIPIPAHNAEHTLAMTLQSALGQTHSDIEVIVVDDGSTDATAQIAAGFSRDGRVRLLRTANQGVAAARNTAIAAARGEFIAPLDADDLWHPRKLELQLERFAQCGPDVGLVYAWTRVLDPQGRVVCALERADIEGWVLHRHLAWNFIGNGSTPLIRRHALAGRAYEPGLQARGAQGSEDYLLQLQIAQAWRFACVPAYLSGYRQTEGSMSSHAARMLRSRIDTLRIVSADLDAPGRRAARRRIADSYVRFGLNQLRARRAGPAAGGFARALAAAPLYAAARTLDHAAHFAGKAQRLLATAPAPAARCFSQWDMLEAGVTTKLTRQRPSEAELDRMAALDRAYAARRGAPVDPEPPARERVQVLWRREAQAPPVSAGASP